MTVHRRRCPTPRPSREGAPRASMHGRRNLPRIWYRLDTSSRTTSRASSDARLSSRDRSSFLLIMNSRLCNECRAVPLQGSRADHREVELSVPNARDLRLERGLVPHREGLAAAGLVQMVLPLCSFPTAGVAMELCRSPLDIQLPFLSAFTEHLLRFRHAITHLLTQEQAAQGRR